MMDLQEVLSRLGAPEAVAILAPHWDESVAAFPAELPTFLDPAEWRIGLEWGEVPPEAEPILAAAVRRIADDPMLLRLVWHTYRLVYHHPDYSGFGEWSSLDEALPGGAGVLSLLLALGSMPRMRATHRARGVPEAVTRDTSRDLGITARRYQAISGGRVGIESRLLSWFRLHATGELYRLGRLQYVVGPFRGKLRAYRHSGSGRVLALAEEGVRFNEEGYIDSATAADPERGWTSHLIESESAVTGSPISPYGMAVPREVTLPLEEWQCVLAPGDTVLQMHIPEGDAMTPEKCRSSMQHALSFFPAFYPDRPFRAFACSSWIFNTQLAEMLPPTSNLAAYQRELYLFPTPAGGRDGLYYIFYTSDVDLARAPRDTTLKRAVLDHLAAGKRLRGGGMFFLREDFEHFGTQYYQSQWPARPGMELTDPDR